MQIISSEVLMVTQSVILMSPFYIPIILMHRIITHHIINGITLLMRVMIIRNPCTKVFYMLL